jgi:uncharacterized Fe-S cluster-containing radical SAM superfamily protein
LIALENRLSDGVLTLLEQRFSQTGARAEREHGRHANARHANARHANAHYYCGCARAHRVNARRGCALCYANARHAHERHECGRCERGYDGGCHGYEHVRARQPRL